MPNEAHQVIAPAALPGVQVSSTAAILHPDSRLCALIWSPAGYGKTELSGSLDDLTQQHLGRRTLYIAVEEGEGGGAATIRHRDVPMFVPKDFNDLYRTLGLLRNDKSYGGVVLDSATECAKKHVKEAALKYPSRENVATRGAGVATRSDYQVMGELMSQVLRGVIGLTTHADPAYRKHVIVTATDKTREEDGRILYQGPDLPGRMATEAVQMFQQVFSLEIKPEQVDGKRQNVRYLVTSADGVKAAKDRYKILPERVRVKSGPQDAAGEDLRTMWEKYYISNMKRS